LYFLSVFFLGYFYGISDFSLFPPFISSSFRAYFLIVSPFFVLASSTLKWC
jgi:hypothetical protein